MTPEQKLAVVRVSLTEMFTVKKYFDVTKLDAICELCGIVIPHELRIAFGAIHCIQFGSMEASLRSWIAEEIDKLFAGSNGITVPSVANMVKLKEIR